MLGPAIGTRLPVTVLRRGAFVDVVTDPHRIAVAGAASRVNVAEVGEQVLAGEDALGLAVDQHQRGVGASPASPPPRSPAGRRRSSAAAAPMCRSTMSCRCACPENSASSRSFSAIEPATSPVTTGARPSARAAARRRTRACSRSPRGRSRSGGRAPARGMPPRLLASTSATVDSAAAGRGQEAVPRHPLVVEDLRQVAAPAVGQQHDHHVVRAGPAGHLQRGGGGHPAGAADQQALLAGQPPGQLERVLVGDLDDLVADRPVVRLRPEVLADALDQVRPAGAAGVDRALRVGADDPYRAAGAP